MGNQVIGNTGVRNLGMGNQVIGNPGMGEIIFGEIIFGEIIFATSTSLFRGGFPSYSVAEVWAGSLLMQRESDERHTAKSCRLAG